MGYAKTDLQAFFYWWTEQWLYWTEIVEIGINFYFLNWVHFMTQHFHVKIHNFWVEKYSNSIFVVRIKSSKINFILPQYFQLLINWRILVMKKCYYSFIDSTSWGCWKEFPLNVILLSGLEGVSSASTIKIVLWPHFNDNFSYFIALFPSWFWYDDDSFFLSLLLLAHLILHTY